MDSIQKKRTHFGLAHWMRQVLEQCDRVGEKLEADPVHDLRVALRRCRSMADGMMAVDSHPAWKQMKKAGKSLFSSLGDLRDAQVTAEWVQRLGTPSDPVARTLFDFASAREHALREDATAALRNFNRKQWEGWHDLLPKRAQRVRLNSVVFKHLALERCKDGYALQQRALRNRSRLALHQLRIGLKKFRYIVENFLPSLHEKWSADLKEVQDWLGEIHDLDVIWATALQISAFPDADARSRWHKRIESERQRRLEKYRRKMLGKESLWQQWRAELPQGPRMEAAAMERLRTWASFLDPDFGHSRHVARLALQLYDKLPGDGFVRQADRRRVRSILQAAALMHDVGRAKRKKNHQKLSFRLIRRLPPPLGWSAHELEMAGTVARYHRGALPEPTDKRMAELSATHQRTVVFLSGILRLAVTLDGQRDQGVERLQVQNGNGFLTVWAEGPIEGRQQEAVAAARHLLEAVYDRPLLVRSRLSGSRQRAAPQDRRAGRSDQEAPAS